LERKNVFQAVFFVWSEERRQKKRKRRKHSVAIAIEVDECEEKE
jgi:hypothetical protein